MLTYETTLEVVRCAGGVDARPGQERVREHQARREAETDRGGRADREQGLRVVRSLCVERREEPRMNGSGSGSGNQGSPKVIVSEQRRTCMVSRSSKRRWMCWFSRSQPTHHCRRAGR